jgi:hypothetical protein
VHAVAMTGWLLLLFVQTTLMANGHRTASRKLIRLARARATILADDLFVWRSKAELPCHEMALPGRAPAADQRRSIASQFSTMGRVGAQYGFGNPRRMMILATLVLMVPALGHLLIQAWRISACMARMQAPQRCCCTRFAATSAAVQHPAYLVGGGLIASWMIGTHFLWDSPRWWQMASTFVGALSAL